MNNDNATVFLITNGIQVYTWETPDGVTGSIESALSAEETDPEIQIALDVVESFILAAACAGIDVSEPAFEEAIETTVDAIYSNMG